MKEGSGERSKERCIESRVILGRKSRGRVMHGVKTDAGSRAMHRVKNDIGRNVKRWMHGVESDE